MIRRPSSAILLWSCMLLAATTGCQSLPSTDVSAASSPNSVSPSLQIPLDVRRLAVLYPKTSNRDLLDAYARLESAALSFKIQRPLLRIVERFDLPTIRSEQAFHLSGAVSDDTIIGLGRLLGVDSILFYRIESPTLRDRVLARIYRNLPPVTVTSKIIRIESAEVVYHNVVTAPVEPAYESAFFSHDPQAEGMLRLSLTRGVDQTIADLQHAFR